MVITALYSLLQLAAGSDYSNPLIEQRADPWIHKSDDGFYYFIATAPEYDRLMLRRATTIQDLASATDLEVWRKNGSGEMSHLIWAPELHQIDGVWTILFAASSSPEVFDVRMYLLMNENDDPFEGEWFVSGPIETPLDSFALDATTFEHNGTRFLVWAQKPPGADGLPDPTINSCLFIAKWKGGSQLLSKPVELTRPELAWERQVYNVNEGPAVLIRHGKVFLTYSASATDHNYSIGLLWANETSDLLDEKSWTKLTDPVFKSSEKTSQYGPGHNSFTVSEDGKTDLLVYHSRDYKAIAGPALANPDRHTRIKPIRWTANGMPDFGIPPGRHPASERGAGSNPEKD
ncbi:MAG: family 43 glycosylhydrolase [Verrucomicrobiota bacterium]